MIPVTLSWTPPFKVGQLLGLDKVEVHTIFPALPTVGQSIFITAYYCKEGDRPQAGGDYYPFTVQEVQFYWETPSNLPEAMVKLELSVKDEFEQQDEMEDFSDYSSEVCNILLNIYGWAKVG